MASLNKVMLIGNLGKDPEVKYLQDGSAVCNFSVATSESWKDKSSGEKKEKTEWHNITIYRQLAEIAGKYLKKGSSVYIEGKLQTRKWQDKETGKDRYTTEIIADSMKMLGKKQDDQNDESYEQEEKTEDVKKLYAKKIHNQTLESFEDDIPF